VFDQTRTLNADNATPSKANKRTWNGTIGGVPWTVFESYSGSVEGIQTLVEGTQNQFLPVSGTTTFPHVCDIAFSDVYQETTAFNAVTLVDLGPVGVQPFVVCKNVNAASIDNVTSKLLQQLLASANLPMSLFTGNAAHSNTPVWLLGRDKGSGTRMSFHYDTDYVTENCNLAYDTGTTWQKKASPGTPEPGYSSGSGVATALGKAGYPAAIGYLSLGDAGALSQVKYNGVTYSRDAVKNGQYSLWCFEHLYTTASSQTRGNAFFDAIWNNLDTVVLPASTSAIAISEMSVIRDGDGAPVHP
jgi:hypothetical protein